MTDSDYLKPDERPVAGPWSCGSCRLHQSLDDVNNSHLVADAVMRDLADALRQFEGHDWEDGAPEWEYGVDLTSSALARYDAITGGSDA